MIVCAVVIFVVLGRQSTLSQQCKSAGEPDILFFCVTPANRETVADAFYREKGILIYCIVLYIYCLYLFNSYSSRTLSITVVQS